METISIRGDEYLNNYEISSIFPFEKPRKGQIFIIDKIIDKLSEYDNVFLTAPTGIGKSAIALGVVNYFKEYYSSRSFIVCHRKALQRQYSDSFGLPIIMGRNNYTCPDTVCDYCPVSTFCTTKPCTCDIGPCTMFPEPPKKAPERIHDMVASKKVYDKLTNKETPKHFRCPLGKSCPYIIAKNTAINSPVSVIGSRYILIDSMYIGALGKRELCIYDEAHSLFNEVSSMLGSNIYQKELVSIGIPAPKENKPDLWLKTFEDMATHITDKFKTINLRTEEGLVEWKRLIRLRNKIETLQRAILLNPDNWLITENNGTFTLSPIWIDTFASAFINNKSVKRLFMSATLIDATQTCKELGLENGNSAWIKVVKSPFPPSNRPIYPLMTANLTYKHMDEEVKKLIPAIQKIIDNNPDKRILILPYTHSLANTIYNGISTPRRVDINQYRDTVAMWLRENNNNPYVFGILNKALDTLSTQRTILGSTNYRELEIIIKCYETVPSSVLITTTLTSGYDGAYDKCRVLIIPKIPYENVSEPLTAKRIKDNPKWYTVNTISTLVQMAGRCCRAVDDYGEIYILDKQFGRIYRQFKYLLPDWFKEAIVWEVAK